MSVLWILLSVILKLVILIPCWFNVVVKNEQGNESKLIVINVDGTRWDYVNSPALVGFPRLAREGSRAEYVFPIFPSNSYPNWNTIVTGLYAENHGFVENFMFDTRTKEVFIKYPHQLASNPRWWNEAEPVWISAEKSGIKTALYGTFGCDVEIKGTVASHCKRHRNYSNVESNINTTYEAIDDILDKFVNQSYRFAMIHFSAVDQYGHLYGPDAAETRRAVSIVDTMLDELQDKLIEHGLTESVNLIVLSDHGMFDLNKAERAINLTDIVDENDILMCMEVGSTVMLLPAPGKLDKVYADLLRTNECGMQVYKREDIPEHYHIKNHPHTLPILLVADTKSFIFPISDPRKAVPPIAGLRYIGFHGYDPYTTEVMRGIFYGRGPAFRRGYVAPFLNMVDHYNVFCYILGIQPLPNNGSWSRVEGMLNGM